MSFKTRKPPISMNIEVKKFNEGVEILSTITVDKSFPEKMRCKATKLKDKILKYSIPFQTEAGEELVAIRLFQNEAVDFLYLLLFKNDNISIKTDYYKILLEEREKIKEQFEEGEKE